MQVVRIIPGCFEELSKNDWPYPLKNRRDGECGILGQNYQHNGVPCFQVTFNYNNHTEDEIIPSKWLEKLGKG